MKYNTIKYMSTVNGEGVRTALFVSGCSIHCKGCFNKEAWDFDFGKELTDDKINEVLDSIDLPYIDGLTILGGEPMDIHNQEGTAHVIDMFRKRFGKEKTIWLYTGYVLENIPDTIYYPDIIDNVDVIVDGPYMQDRNIKNDFRGSDNQHINYLV